MANRKTATHQKELYLRMVNKSEDYIEAHLKEPITLKDLARYAHLSEFHFHRMFKHYSSETVNEFVTRFKLERAAIYLCLYPTLTITTIAMTYGYSDSSAFSRTFKNHFGVSPINYRKQQEWSRTPSRFM